MLKRPNYSFIRSIYYVLRITIANMRKKPFLKFLDNDDKFGVRQFISYNPKARSFYVEAVFGMQLRNQEFVWPLDRKNVWRAIDEADKMSLDILRVVAPDMVKHL